MTLVLGINDGHNGTACLLRDGRIIACASEERFNRIKNYWGFPSQAIRYCLGEIHPSQVDLAVYSTRHLSISLNEVGERGIFKTARLVGKVISPSRTVLLFGYKAALPFLSRPHQKKRVALLEEMGFSTVEFMDHHTAHSYAGGFSSGFDDALILTNDGQGDGLSATVSIKSGNRITRVSETPYTDSLGYFYFQVTKYLGMKGLEDEHKVMGLAAYAREPDIDAFAGQFDVEDDLSIHAKVPAGNYEGLIYKSFLKQRFDGVAASAQLLTEEVLTKWVRKAVERYRPENLVLSGGTFLNIKANMKIAESWKGRIYVMPSPGDESNAIGAAYYGYLTLERSSKVEPLSSVFLGPSFTDGEVNYDTNSLVAELLARGEIVARFDGRMEFGSRALGNRSILARPDDPRMVLEINRQIKSRDFWMPFAPTIMEEEATYYIESPDFTRLNSGHMVFAFQGTEKTRKDLVAASHQYDNTLRPQILSSGGSYADLLVKFRSLTGIGALLNTSFNLHGEPIVCTPQDALSTFNRSGLKYMVMGRKLITKKEAQLVKA